MNICMYTIDREIDIIQIDGQNIDKYIDRLYM